MEESGGREALAAAALARRDQEAARMDYLLDRSVRAARADLAAGVDYVKVLEVAADAAAYNGIEYSAAMFAHALLRLARQAPTS